MSAVAGPLLKPRQLLQSIRPPDEHLRMMNTPDGAPCSSVLSGALQLKWLVLGCSPTATRKSTETKFETKAHKITNPTFMFANGLQKPQ